MASSITVTNVCDPFEDHSILVLKLACVAHTDGTFTAKEITAAEVGFNYWQYGLCLKEAWAVNPATGYPTVAATVSIADEVGSTILISTELSVSTSASGVVEAAPAKNRIVNNKLTITIGDTGSAANTVDIYLKFVGV